MPFQCDIDRGQVVLTPAPSTRYELMGRRLEQPHTVCASAGTMQCQFLMVHKFKIACAGKTVDWAAVAAAGQAFGVALPNDLPKGYAPVTGLAGRLILPALAADSTSVLPSEANQGGEARLTLARMDRAVFAEELSPNGVIVRTQAHTASPIDGGWQTIVRAELSPDSSEQVIGVGQILVALLVMLTSISVLASGRLKIPFRLSRVRLFDTAGSATSPPGWRDAVASVQLGAQRLWTGLAERSSQAWKDFIASADCVAGEGLSNAIRTVEARLAEAELAVATLNPDQLLSSVLRNELDQIRERFSSLKKGIERRSPAKSAAMVRAALRDLERIDRIAQSSQHAGGDGFGFDDQATSNAPDDAPAAPPCRMPETVAEAYHVLGINADAPPTATKKLVDALRMTWHPDMARDEADRQRREERMKQINTAWDLVKARFAEAA